MSSPLDVAAGGNISAKGGDAMSSAASDGRFYYGDQGGMFAPMYVGGSGGGFSGGILTILIGIGLLWGIKSHL